MPTTPHWFAADNFFSGKGGWYIGSRTGFSVGPYPTEATARLHSLEVQRRLARAKDGGDALRVVREFLADKEEKVDKEDGGSSPEPSVRAGEGPRMWYRAERCFAVGDRWYFLTREGIDVGPYDSKALAELEVRRLIRLLENCETEAQRRLAIYEFLRRPVVGR